VEKQLKRLLDTACETLGQIIQEHISFDRGYILIMFDFNVHEPDVAYISNAQRSDAIIALRQMALLLEQEEGNNVKGN